MLAELFFAGKYQELIDSYSEKDNRNEVSFLLGALVFVGNITEASYVHSQVDKADIEQYLRSKFFYFIGLMRISQYERAEVILDEMECFEIPKKQSSLSYFFYQARAFKCYYYGLSDQSLKFANLSYKESLMFGRDFEKIFSLDLRGHGLIDLGNVHEGLDLVEEALKLAKKNEYKGLIPAFEVTLKKYRLCFLHEELDLEDKYNVVDHYSESEYFLECINYLILRGDFKSAKFHLEKASAHIYSMKNRRQMARYQIKYAFFTFITGMKELALSLLGATENYLDRKVDNRLLLEACGLKLDILINIGDEEQIKETVSELEVLSGKFDSIKNQTYKYLRGLDNNSPSLIPGNDIVAEILVGLKQGSKTSFNKIIDNRLHFFLYKYYEIEFGNKVLVLDEYKDIGVRFDPILGVAVFNLTDQSVSLIQAFSIKNVWTKQELLKNVWEIVSYNPIIHDPVLYQGLARFRRNVDFDWISFEDNSIKFQGEIVSIKMNKHEGATKEIQGSGANPSFQKLDDHKLAQKLNRRQFKLLSLLKVSDSIGPKEYREIFSIGTMTSYRDLNWLVEQSVLEKRGKGRATYYIRIL